MGHRFNTAILRMFRANGGTAKFGAFQDDKI